MDKRDDTVCSIFCCKFKEVLIKKTHPSYTINLSELNHLLGVIFHTPKDKSPVLVRVLIDYKVITPKNKDYWSEFIVNR